MTDLENLCQWRENMCDNRSGEHIVSVLKKTCQWQNWKIHVAIDLENVLVIDMENTCFSDRSVEYSLWQIWRNLNYTSLWQIWRTCLWRIWRLYICGRSENICHKTEAIIFNNERKRKPIYLSPHVDIMWHKVGLM